jgi:hypothetical protein
MPKRRRRYVNRNDRVKPSAMAEAKKRPWPLAQLLQRGPDAGGIDADEFEAALQIVEAFEALTRGLGTAALDLTSPRVRRAGHTPPSMSGREAALGATWFDWAERLPWRAVAIVEAIRDERPISVPALRHACRLWAQVAGDRARARRREVVAAE